MIKIRVSNGVPYIWNAQDWRKLREEYRIIGAFDGAEGTGWSSPIHLHLPLRLSTVETQYLIFHGMAETVAAPSLESCDIKVPQAKVDEYNQRKLRSQLESYKRKRMAEIEIMVDKIVEGKKKRGRTAVIPDRESIIQSELRKANKPPYEMVQIDLNDPWIEESEYISFLFPLPKTQLEKVKFLVFEDFHHRRKYTLTAGEKFGGDFLAYPGEPFQYHSEYIIMCQDKTRQIPKSHINSQNRLATVVKKTLLIAYLNDDSKLKYILPKNPHGKCRVQDS